VLDLADVAGQPHQVNRIWTAGFRPVSFRVPALTARMAAAVDDLSGGRLTLCLGAGWQEREHNLFGLDLLDLKSRLCGSKKAWK